MNSGFSFILVDKGRIPVASSPFFGFYVKQTSSIALVLHVICWFVRQVDLGSE